MAPSRINSWGLVQLEDTRCPTRNRLEHWVRVFRGTHPGGLVILGRELPCLAPLGLDRVVKGYCGIRWICQLSPAALAEVPPADDGRARVGLLCQDCEAHHHSETFRFHPHQGRPLKLTGAVPGLTSVVWHYPAEATWVVAEWGDKAGLGGPVWSLRPLLGA